MCVSAQPCVCVWNLHGLLLDQAVCVDIIAFKAVRQWAVRGSAYRLKEESMARDVGACLYSKFMTLCVLAFAQYPSHKVKKGGAPTKDASIELHDVHNDSLICVQLGAVSQ